ncbi:succinate dehydrogenase, hydrophobic membrane anchor protein [Parendozoicomonas sp. Alg238-R29]|uniref:succinate dehydrogenase, hydrophobic membrane anchor protein n=1 Tax=Parendozoicomonas sp. Alg238-R29 TaxID=2993446 RepID=UPI00248F19E6|nr:succinate dehydrogenase, hydrophobic membrane anchor protein [Parendozoicomonas sp. Alg238-R29]
MVTNITNLSRSGLYDWMVQRVTALVLATFTVFMVAWLLCTSPVGFDEWKALFDQTWMRVFSLLTLISLGAHAWVGMWTISGDYLNERALGKKALIFRFLFQALCGITMFSYVVWGVQILWGL